MVKLLQLIERIHSHEVEFVLVGGLAASTYGVTLVTRDVEICCSLAFPNMLRLQKAIGDLHPVYRMTNDLPMEITEQLCANLKNLYLRTDWGVLDCLGEVLGVGPWEVVKKRSIPIDLGFASVPVLEVNALIAAKEAMGRPHDIQTVHQLKSMQKGLKLN